MATGSRGNRGRTGRNGAVKLTCNSKPSFSPATKHFSTAFASLRQMGSERVTGLQIGWVAHGVAPNGLGEKAEDTGAMPLPVARKRSRRDK